MDFTFTPEQIAWRDRARRLAEDVVLPRAVEVDETAEYPWDIQRAMAQAGLSGLNIPKEYGGAGADLTTLCLVGMEINRACASSGAILAAQVLGSFPLVLAGTPEQKATYLPGLAAGETQMAFALTERGAGSDPASMTTTAMRDGADWIVSGDKCFVGNGGPSDLYVVFARTDPEACARGISAFLVEKRTPGVAVGKAEKKMGIRGTVTSELHFRDVRVPAANLLGEPGNGLRLALATLDLARPTCAAQALGIAQAAFEEAVAYARQRRQFGQRIADFEAIQFMLADMATQLEAGKLLLLKTCALHDAGERRITAEAAMCKLFCSEAAKFIVDRCVQIHGGYGYCGGHNAERHYRDQRITEIYEGTSEIQRLVIARHILAD